MLCIEVKVVIGEEVAGLAAVERVEQFKVYGVVGKLNNCFVVWSVCRFESLHFIEAFVAILWDLHSVSIATDGYFLVNEGLQRSETERNVRVLIDMNMFPHPISWVGRHILSQELISIIHCSRNIVHAMFWSSVFTRIAILANSVEFKIIWIFYQNVQHSLEIINEWIVSNDCKSHWRILNLLLEQRVVEIELPSGKNSCSNALLWHISIPMSEFTNDFLSMLRVNRTEDI